LKNEACKMCGRAALPCLLNPRTIAHAVADSAEIVSGMAKASVNKPIFTFLSCMKAAALANMDIGKSTKKATEATSYSCTFYVES